jgi:endo-1,4-beta-mannosidase
LLNGAPYRFTGVNYFQAGGGCGYSPNLSQDLTNWGSGKEALRTWFFQKTTGTGATRDWSRFDNVIATAKAHGMTVIPTLVNEWRDCESNSGQRTRSWYVNGYKTAVEPGDKTSFRQYVQDIVTHYKDEPGIAFWQIINEGEVPADTGGCAADAETVFRAFADDVGGLIHSIDRNHLVSLGTIGSGQCGARDTEYQALHASPGIDLCEYHDYAAPTAAIPGDQWNGLQHRIDQCNTLNKPLFIGESGITLSEAGGSAQTRANLFNNKISAAFGQGVDGYLPWGYYDAAHIGTSGDPYNIGPNDPVLGVVGSW